MMQQLIHKLQTEQCNLVILHDGKIHTFDGHGIRTLYGLLNSQPELLYNSKIAVKAVGRTAACAMAEGKVAEVFAEFISDQACAVLEESGVKISFDTKLNHEAFLDVWKRLGELNN